MINIPNKKGLFIQNIIFDKIIMKNLPMILTFSLILLFISTNVFAQDSATYNEAVNVQIIRANEQENMADNTLFYLLIVIIVVIMFFIFILRKKVKK